MAYYHTKIMCDVESLKYDFETKRGVLEIADGHATDAGGTVEVFQAVDPDVEEILVLAGGRPDILYRPGADGWSGTPL
ncbi:hypothetical protein [Agrobacterium pusense]|uniref:hypothetical protein n=1 Tax=Agrobacterium pusense TaxID=648995 RepID=UPI001AE53F7F|nr:hypothetical protein [Agrobacterium pusense]MBP2611424.1 hypothetical protein [Agrobacterium pusense]